MKESVEQMLELEKNYFDLLWEQIKKRKFFSVVIKLLVNNSNPYKVKNLERQQIYHILSELEKKEF